MTVRHRPTNLVGRLDFLTTPGRRTDGEAEGPARRTGRGVTRVITDLGILEPTGEDRELTLTHVHPGVTVADVEAATAWPLRVAGAVHTTEPPTKVELEVLRDLRERTARAHAERERP